MFNKGTVINHFYPKQPINAKHPFSASLNKTRIVPNYNIKQIFDKNVAIGRSWQK